jgi:hypothetical protein
MIQHIVVWDPSQKVREGSILPGEGMAAELQRAGVITLPCEQELFERSPVAGFFSKHWGPGWPYAGRRATRGCGMLLYVAMQAQWIHWVARLAPINSNPAQAEELEGMLRLTNLGGQAGASSGGISAVSEAVDLTQLAQQPRNASGEWVVRGQARVQLNADGFMALCLQGACAGVKILQSAVSLTR